MNISRNKTHIAETIQNIYQSVANHNHSVNGNNYIEKIYKRLFELSPIGIFIMDMEGFIRYCNPSTHYEKDYSEKDLIGKHFSKVIAALGCDVTEYNQIYESLIQDKAPQTFEFTYRRKDGSTGYTEVHASFLDTEGSDLDILIYAIDITERKLVEEALRESQEFNNSLLEKAPNQLLVINPDTSIRYVNPAFEETNGWTSDEVIGMKVPYPWWPEESREEFKAGFMEAMKQGSGQGEVIAQKKNGEQYWLALKWASITRDGELAYLLINSIDITQRIQAEEALRESEEKYRDLLDNTNELIQSITPDGRFRYVNKSWLQTMGYNANEVPNRTIFDIIHPDYLEHYQTQFLKIMSGEEIGSLETAFVSKNGSKVIVEGNVTCKFEDGKPVYTRGIFRDITNSKYLEEQMFRLSSAVSMSTDCIVITDSDAKIIDVNSRYLEMYGATSKDELTGRHFLELIAPAERVIVNSDVKELLDKGYLECREYHMISKQGHEFPVKMSTSLVRAADGKPMGIVRVGSELEQCA